MSSTEVGPEPIPRRSVFQPIALLDLGGTLCDSASALRDGLAGLRGPTEPIPAEWVDPADGHLEMRRRLVMARPGFWRELAPLAVGFELLQLVREEGFRAHIVTKGPYDVPEVWADKVAWCRRHLPDVPVVITDHKSLVFGHVLIDDWPPYVDEWQQHWTKSLAILPAQPWNLEVPVTENFLRYDGSNRDDIQVALRALHARVKAVSRDVCP